MLDIISPILFSQSHIDYLRLDLSGAIDAKLGYVPIPIATTRNRPAEVKVEPHYRTSPVYGTFNLGNGPRNAYPFALDEPSNADFKIYIDRNQDGDLTNDGDGSWNAKREGQRTTYGPLNVTLRASYGTRTKEFATSQYRLGIYRTAKPEPNPLYIYRMSARVGSVSLDGHRRRAILVESDADAVFNKVVRNAVEATQSRPVFLHIDLKGDGTLETVDIRGPFQLGQAVYEARVSPDGARLQVQRSSTPPSEFTVRPKAAQPLISPGTMAADFSIPQFGGGTIRLSDLRGQVVVLDFWATWCTPCLESLPHLESVYQATRDQKVTVIGICVLDQQENYDKWMKANNQKYTFPFGFDPAGQNASKSFANADYHVTAIPATYVIDREGKVADVLVGFSKEDQRLEEALKKLGVRLSSNPF